jgi:hypothetical protein
MKLSKLFLNSYPSAGQTLLALFRPRNMLDAKVHPVDSSCRSHFLSMRLEAGWRARQAVGQHSSDDGILARVLSQVRRDVGQAFSIWYERSYDTHRR